MLKLDDIKKRFEPIWKMQEELICIYDTELKIVDVNDAYCYYFKKQRDELVGKSFLTFIPKEEHHYIYEKLSQISPENPMVKTTHRVKLENGRISWQEWKDFAIFDSDGKIKEFQSIGKDITEIKKLKEEISALKIDCKRKKQPVNIICKDLGKKVVVPAIDILYIKANLTSVLVVTAQSILRAPMQIKEIESTLKGFNFFRVHRSYIVNLNRVKMMESLTESRYKIFFDTPVEPVITSKKGAKELRFYFKNSPHRVLFK